MKEGISSIEARGKGPDDFIYGDPRPGWKITYRDQYGLRQTYMQIGFQSYEAAKRELDCIRRNDKKWRKKGINRWPRAYWKIKEYISRPIIGVKK